MSKIFSLPTVFLFLVTSTQLAHAASLRVVIDNIPSREGQILVKVVASKAAFAGKAPATATLTLPATHEKIAFTLDALTPGEYGIRIRHDQNNNGKLDKNLVGMPTEAYGFSNNAAGTFGPPSWDDAKFVLNAPSQQIITLH